MLGNTLLVSHYEAANQQTCLITRVVGATSQVKGLPRPEVYLPLRFCSIPTSIEKIVNRVRNGYSGYPPT